MLVALGAVWFLFFIPSWAKRSAEREQSRDEFAQIKHEATKQKARVTSSVVTKNALAADRALRAKRIGAAIAFIALCASAWSISVVATVFEAWYVLGGSLVVFAFGILINRVSARAYSSSLVESRNRRKSRPFAYTTSLAPVGSESRTTGDSSGLAPNGWVANSLPKPLYKGSEGTLVDVQFAEVLELPSKDEVVLESETLDEILRRRRANG